MRAVSGPRITGKQVPVGRRRDFVDDGSSARLTEVRRGADVPERSVWLDRRRHRQLHHPALGSHTRDLRLRLVRERLGGQGSNAKPCGSIRGRASIRERHVERLGDGFSTLFVGDRHSPLGRDSSVSWQV
jgi:hypothetical protein